MKKLSIRNLALIVLVAVAILAIGVFSFQNRPQDPESIVEVSENEGNQENQNDSDQEFVTDIDMNIDNWQTKETEFFTIKFPKEWYWMESSREKTGYRSYVITNNPNFDIDRYADIGVFTGGRYLFTSESEGIESRSLPLKDTEAVISFTIRSTKNSGTPQDSLDYILRSAKEDETPVQCELLNNKMIPYEAYCSVVYEDNQLQQSYHIINELHSLVFSARTVEDTFVDKKVFDAIAENIILRESF